MKKRLKNQSIPVASRFSARSRLGFGTTVVVGWLALATSVCGQTTDLGVAVIGLGNLATVGELITFQVDVTNHGPGVAPAVVLTNSVSTNAAVFSITTSQGSCIASNGVVRCSLGGMSPGSGAVVTIVVTGQWPGTVTNRAHASTSGADPVIENNTDQKVATVVPATFYPAGTLKLGRHLHSATLLPNGKVLIVGGLTSTGTTATAEVYDPASGTSEFTGSMTARRDSHTATLLNDGRVLIAGYSEWPWGYADLYNPETGSFERVGGLGATRLSGHTATLLSNGKVLITGGYGTSGWYLSSAELFDPATGTFSWTDEMTSMRSWHTATVLTNGSVLIAGGQYFYSPPIKGDIYAPEATALSLTANTMSSSQEARASLLSDGRVLISGGNTPRLADAVIFDSASGQFSGASNMFDVRRRHTSTALEDGTVLICGGTPRFPGESLSSAELYVPAMSRFVRTVDMLAARDLATATRLLDGRVLVVGGFVGSPTGETIHASVELYDPARTKIPPSLHVTDASVLEDTGTLHFEVRLSSPMGRLVTVDYITAPGTALEGRDYGSLSGTLVFPAGTTNQSLEISIRPDLDYEQAETFFVRLSNPTNALLAVREATGLILNDDERPAISISSVTVMEGNGYTTNLVFLLQLSAASFEPISLGFSTSDGTALGGSDYFPTNGSILFEPGVTNWMLVTAVRSDIALEPNEVFHLNLTNATNATIAVTRGLGTILNDDGVPGVVEHFDISFLGSPQHVGVPFPVVITARDWSGLLVTNFSGRVMLSGSISNVLNYRFEFEEGDFSQWTPLGLGSSPGPYQIVVFDVAGQGVPSLAFRLAADSGAADGISRTVVMQGGVNYDLQLDVAAMNEVFSINYAPGTAHLQIDGLELATAHLGDFGPIGPYQVFRTNILARFLAPSNGTYQLSLRFDRGFAETQDLWIYADDVRISSPPLAPVWLPSFTNGTWSGEVNVAGAGLRVSLHAEDLEGHQGDGNAFDVLPAADLRLQANVPASGRVGENLAITLAITNQGPSTASAVRLTNTLAGNLTIVSVVASLGSCTTSGQIVLCDIGTMTNGQRGTISVTVRPSTIGLVTNTAFVLSTTFDGNGANNNATNLITSAPPLIFIDNVSVLEGDAETNRVFEVRLSGASGETVSLDYATVNGTALAGLDYTTATGRLVFPPGVVTQYAAVRILGDTLDEPAETLTVHLSNPTNAVLSGNGQATISVDDNDPPVAISVGDASVIEGDAGTGLALFPITLSQPSGFTVTAQWGTSNGTAAAVNDYNAITSGSISFAPGATSNTLNVTVRGDTVNESNETFFVVLRAPGNATLSRATGTGTILNDDLVHGQLDHFEWLSLEPLQLLGRPISGTVIARDAFNDTVTNFSGNVPLSATARTGAVTVAVSPGTLNGFSSGVWTGAVTLFLSIPTTHVVIKADDGQQHLGLSSPFNVVSKYPVMLSAPASANEGDGLLQSRLIVTMPRSVDIVFTMTSSDPTEVTIPPNVLLPAGQTSVVFNVTIEDDGDIDGSQAAMLSATQADYTTGEATLMVHDNEMATLSVLLADTLTEGMGTIPGAGTLSVDQPPAGNLSVALASSDTTELTLPVTVVIAAGQTSAFFNVTLPNDNLLDGPQPVAITAHVQNWTSAVKLVSVLDNESTNLVLQLPASIIERSGTVTNGGSVRISGTLSSNLVVLLMSSDLSELTVPSVVTIPAGQTSAPFSLFVPDDAELDGRQTVAVSASATGLGPANRVVIVVDDDVHHFGFVRIPTIQTATVPFTVTISARAIDDGLVSTFDGTVSLSGNGTRGSIVLQPTNTMPFQAGQWNGPVSIGLWDTAIQLRAEASGRSGESNPFDAVAPILQVINLAAADLLYDPFAKRIYASVPATGGPLSNHLAIIEPVVGCLEEAFYVGDDPGKLALSDDGRFLYVACNGSSSGSNSVRRFDLTSREMNLEIFMGRHDYYTHLFYYAHDMAVLPGNPRSVAISKCTTFNGLFPTIVIFDDDTARTNVLGPISQNGPAALEVASPTRLYVAGYFYRVTLDASGVASYDIHEGLTGFYGDMKFHRGRIYNASGSVFDPETFEIFGSLPATYLVEPDLTVGRVFAISQEGPPWSVTWRLLACDPVTLLPVGSVVLQGLLGGPGSLIRWGDEGVAFRTSAGQIFLVRSPLISDTDSDGMPDAWENQHFGGLNTPMGNGAADPDGDGMGNKQEWLAGTNPLIASDVLRISSIHMLGTDVWVGFPTIRGKRYQLQRTSEVPGVWEPIPGDAMGSGSMQNAIDVGGAAFLQRLYRLQVQP